MTVFFICGDSPSSFFLGIPERALPCCGGARRSEFTRGELWERFTIVKGCGEDDGGPWRMMEDERDLSTEDAGS